MRGASKARRCQDLHQKSTTCCSIDIHFCSTILSQVIRSSMKHVSPSCVTRSRPTIFSYGLIAQRSGKSARRITQTRRFYISWSESFTNPFDNQLWVAKIDDSAAAGDRMIVQAENLRCTNFITIGFKQHLIPPDRFIQIAIQANQTATWIMERIKKTHWDGFHIYQQSLAHTIQKLKQIPSPVETVYPKIKGFPVVNSMEPKVRSSALQTRD